MMLSIFGLLVLIGGGTVGYLVTELLLSLFFKRHRLEKSLSAVVKQLQKKGWNGRDAITITFASGEKLHLSGGHDGKARTTE